MQFKIKNTISYPEYFIIKIIKGDIRIETEDEKIIYEYGEFKPMDNNQQYFLQKKLYEIETGEMYLINL